MLLPIWSKHTKIYNIDTLVKNGCVWLTVEKWVGDLILSFNIGFFNKEKWIYKKSADKNDVII